MLFTRLFDTARRKLTSFPKRQIERFFNRRVSKNDHLRDSIFHELENGIKQMFGKTQKTDYGIQKTNYGLSNPPIQHWMGNAESFPCGNAYGTFGLLTKPTGTL